MCGGRSLHLSKAWGILTVDTIQDCLSRGVCWVKRGAFVARARTAPKNHPEAFPTPRAVLQPEDSPPLRLLAAESFLHPFPSFHHNMARSTATAMVEAIQQHDGDANEVLTRVVMPD